jgi:hypothetical protein
MKAATVVVAMLSLVLAGCSSTRFEAPSSTSQTQVVLTGRNYRIVKANAIGSSMGFKLLGIIAFANTSYPEAMSRLYATAGPAEGKALAVTNVGQERTALYFILFSLPKLTVRADVIEFMDERPSGWSAQGAATSPSVPEKPVSPSAPQATTSPSAPDKTTSPSATESATNANVQEKATTPAAQ